MPAARWMWAMLATLALLATACSTVSEVSVHSAGYQAGLSAGRQARQGHRYYFRHATRYEKAAFCIKRAISDVQHMNGPLLDWTVGFEHGCRLVSPAIAAQGLADR